MDTIDNEKDSIRKREINPSMKQEARSTSFTEKEEKTSYGPTILFLWVWNWFTTLPKTMTNLYTDLKSGELLAKFSLLDAMLQFIFAVATSCHPQEDGVDGEVDDQKVNGENYSSSKTNDLKVFGGSGRTLRSRTIATNS